MIAPAHGSNVLGDLAARIAVEHAAAAASLQAAVAHAIACGELLIKAKAQLAHGEWLPWLASNCHLSPRTARLYMQLAHNRKSLNRQCIANMTIADAVDLLAPIGSPTHTWRILQLELESIDPRIRISPLGLSLPEDLTNENWLAVGTILNAIEHGWHSGLEVGE